MKKAIVKLMCITGLFAACNGGDDAYTPAANTQVVPLTIAKDSPASLTSPATTNPLQLKPLSNATPVQSTAIIPPVPAGKSGAAGTNPAHGMAGHRCDIPVGAALSLPVQQPAATQTSPVNNVVSTVASPVQAAPKKVVTAPGMNPPHGEPNHRCDIAVGAPLTSAAPVQNKVEPLKKDSGT